MAGYKKQHTDGPNSEDKALDLFAEMMIEKIESIRKDWRKPWFTEEALQWPCNLSGREYNGMNAIMLLIHCEKEGYKIPRFCTFECVQRLNKSDKDNQEKPRVSVLRGEKSFPIMLTHSPAYTRILVRRLSMMTTKNYLITRRRNTMFILRCRYSESLTWHRPTCRRQDRSCGKNSKRSIRYRRLRTESISASLPSMR